MVLDSHLWQRYLASGVQGCPVQFGSGEGFLKMTQSYLEQEVGQQGYSVSLPCYHFLPWEVHLRSLLRQTPFFGKLNHHTDPPVISGKEETSGAYLNTGREMGESPLPAPVSHPQPSRPGEGLFPSSPGLWRGSLLDLEDRRRSNPRRIFP